MITRIEAYGYRCFPALSVDLDRHHVIVGSNGAGKTTLLDIPVLLGDLMRQRRVAHAFLEALDRGKSARAGTLLELLHRQEGDAISFAVEARLPADHVDILASTSMARLGRPVPTHLRYEVRLDVTRRTLQVADESMYLFTENGDRPEPGFFFQAALEKRSVSEVLESTGWQLVISRERNGPTRFTPETTTRETEIPPYQFTPDRLGLSDIPTDPTLFPAAVWFAQLLREGVVFLSPDWDALRRPAPPGDPERLEPSGRNIPWLALALQENDPERFTAWVEHLRVALPQVATVKVVESEGEQRAYFDVEYTSGHRVTSSGLSEGTLRLMTLTLLPFLDEKALPSLLVTEEPENGVHPRAIETVTRSLASISGAQVWVSTHSPIVLAHTRLDEVLAARLRDDGGADVVPGHLHPRLRDWQGTIDIGTLFAAGVLS
ncbi:methylation-associated defense system AAA family ATPase MAD3 [Thermomonospora umbrina]|uniref:Putative ATPase n=1 Tax=Thermomonospora umbrina TaxID=111806 RepID=A0A3D9SMX3_9ACTN|nr:AAA family ATPase [Thermomonospora umbrina]REE95760.1 putative ATPase [Thermomonospora umbrina]